MAYRIANGQVNANPLVNKDGMINLAMDYESEAESEGSISTDESLQSYNSDQDEPKEVFVDPIAPTSRGNTKSSPITHKLLITQISDRLWRTS